jgi:hypothetical protein
MRIFLETSVPNNSDLSKVSELVLQRHVKGDQIFHLSFSHFQIYWGYSIAGRSPQKYKEFLNAFGVELAPPTKRDAQEAAGMRPERF